eukprot:scaffold687140_cov83-Attheya_sp.AAC.1
MAYPFIIGSMTSLSDVSSTKVGLILVVGLSDTKCWSARGQCRKLGWIYGCWGESGLLTTWRGTWGPQTLCRFETRCEVDGMLEVDGDKLGYLDGVKEGNKGLH